MKKFLLVVISVMMALCMTACGNGQESVGADEAKNVPKFDTSYDIEETVLADESGVKIMATELTYTEYEVQVNVLVENNSDKNYHVYTGAFGNGTNAVNGYMLDGYMDVDVSAGNKVNEVISYDIEWLQEYGITKIADFLFAFTIEDEKGEDFVTAPIQVKTKAAQKYDYPVSTYAEAVKAGVVESVLRSEVNYFAEDVLYEQNGVSVVSQVLLTDMNGMQEAFLEVVNNSDQMVSMTTSSIAVNGLIVGGGINRFDAGDIIYPGTRRVISIPLFLMLDTVCTEVMGSSEIGNLSMELVLKDADINSIAKPQEIEIVVAENVPMFEADGTEIFNSEGIRILSKGLIETQEDSSNFVSLVLLVENMRDERVSFEQGYDLDYKSLSFNGVTLDSYFASRYVLPGKVTFIEIWVTEEDLQEIGITSVEGIKEAEFLMEVRNDDYEEIAVSSLKFDF